MTVILLTYPNQIAHAKYGPWQSSANVPYCIQYTYLIGGKILRATTIMMLVANWWLREFSIIALQPLHCERLKWASVPALHRRMRNGTRKPKSKSICNATKILKTSHIYIRACVHVFVCMQYVQHEKKNGFDWLATACLLQPRGNYS